MVSIVDIAECSDIPVSTNLLEGIMCYVKSDLM